jgi:hypothetical protein
MKESEPVQKCVSEVVKSFNNVLEEIKIAPGEKTTLLSFAKDTFADLRRIHSMYTTILNKDILNQGLTQFIQELIPEGESRETLEAKFNKSPERTKGVEDCIENNSEWTTTYPNVVIGIRTINDQDGERVRGWYLRNTDSKPNFLTSIAKRILSRSSTTTASSSTPTSGESS